MQVGNSSGIGDPLSPTEQMSVSASPPPKKFRIPRARPGKKNGNRFPLAVTAPGSLTPPPEAEPAAAIPTEEAAELPGGPSTAPSDAADELEGAKNILVK
mmetsp:Transcript_38501/g.75623  ORF Transcript_38501/g.75623 Transcript_38501/m.75623 type:complete len:100 (-) Transcript_38501:1922-2221(-)